MAAMWLGTFRARTMIEALKLFHGRVCSCARFEKTRKILLPTENWVKYHQTLMERVVSIRCLSQPIESTSNSDCSNKRELQRNPTRWHWFMFHPMFTTTSPSLSDSMRNWVEKFSPHIFAKHFKFHAETSRPDIYSNFSPHEQLVVIPSTSPCCQRGTSLANSAEKWIRKLKCVTSNISEKKRKERRH